MKNLRFLYNSVAPNFGTKSPGGRAKVRLSPAPPNSWYQSLVPRKRKCKKAKVFAQFRGTKLWCQEPGGRREGGRRHQTLLPREKGVAKTLKNHWFFAGNKLYYQATKFTTRYQSLLPRFSVAPKFCATGFPPNPRFLTGGLRGSKVGRPGKCQKPTGF